MTTLTKTFVAGALAFGLGFQQSQAAIDRNPGPLPEEPLASMSAIPDSTLSRCIKQIITKNNAPALKYTAQRFLSGQEPVVDIFSAISERDNMRGGTVISIDQLSNAPDNMMVSFFFASDATAQSLDGPHDASVTVMLNKDTLERTGESVWKLGQAVDKKERTMLRTHATKTIDAIRTCVNPGPTP